MLICIVVCVFVFALSLLCSPVLCVCIFVAFICISFVFYLYITKIHSLVFFSVHVRFFFLYSLIVLINIFVSVYSFVNVFVTLFVWAYLPVINSFILLSLSFSPSLALSFSFSLSPVCALLLILRSFLV